MGAGNVAVVYSRWSRHVPDRAFRLLVFMALQSLDKDRPPRYWGGREILAELALGRPLPAEPDAEDASPEAAAARRARNAAFVAVRAGIADLTRVGVVRIVSRGAFGRRSEYALELWTEPSALQDHPAPMAQGDPAPVRRVILRSSQAEPAPETQGEPAPEEDVGGRGTDEEPSSTYVSSSGAVDSSCTRAIA